MMSDHEELIAKANQRIPNLPRESLSNQEKLILDMRNALEAVTVPTENEHANGLPSREELAVAILMVTQEGVSPEYAWSVQYAEVQDELLAQADAVLELLPSGLPVPVEPEWEYGFSADGGAVVDRAFGIVPFETAESARHTGSKWFEETLDIMRRTKAIPAGKWQPVNTNETGEKP